MVWVKTVVILVGEVKSDICKIRAVEATPRAAKSNLLVRLEHLSDMPSRMLKPIRFDDPWIILAAAELVVPKCGCSLHRTNSRNLLSKANTCCGAVSPDLL